MAAAWLLTLSWKCGMGTMARGRPLVLRGPAAAAVAGAALATPSVEGRM